jgi:hypothetical protein
VGAKRRSETCCKTNQHGVVVVTKAIVDWSRVCSSCVSHGGLSASSCVDDLFLFFFFFFCRRIGLNLLSFCPALVGSWLWKVCRIQEQHNSPQRLSSGVSEASRMLPKGFNPICKFFVAQMKIEILHSLVMYFNVYVFMKAAKNIK